jgi:hypothetical protein
MVLGALSLYACLWYRENLYLCFYEFVYKHTHIISIKKPKHVAFSASLVICESAHLQRVRCKLTSSSARFRSLYVLFSRSSCWGIFFRIRWMDTNQEEVSASLSWKARTAGGSGIYVVWPFAPLCSQSSYKLKMLFRQILIEKLTTARHRDFGGFQKFAYIIDSCIHTPHREIPLRYLSF